MQDKPNLRQLPKLKIAQPSRNGEMPRVSATSNLVKINGKMVPNPVRQPGRGTPFG